MQKRMGFIKKIHQTRGGAAPGRPFYLPKKRVLHIIHMVFHNGQFSRAWYSSALPTRPTADREALDRSISSPARTRTSSRVTAS